MAKKHFEVEKKQLSDEELSEMTLRYISSSQFIIPTKSILELEMKIQTWLTIGACGSITYGRSNSKTGTFVHMYQLFYNQNRASYTMQIPKYGLDLAELNRRFLE